jgi:hypothetical protein
VSRARTPDVEGLADRTGRPLRVGLDIVARVHHDGQAFTGTVAKLRDWPSGGKGLVIFTCTTPGHTPRSCSGEHSCVPSHTTITTPEEGAP